jgi:hypothetical protein
VKAAPPAAAPAPQPQRHEPSLHVEKEATPVDSAVPGRRSTRGGVGAFVFLLLVLTLAGGAYVYRARLWPWIARHAAFRIASAPAAQTPIGAPGGSSPSVAGAQSATAITLTASPSATAQVDADAGAHAKPAALDASADVGTANAPTHRPARHTPRHYPAAATEPAADLEE